MIKAYKEGVFCAAVSEMIIEHECFLYIYVYIKECKRHARMCQLRVASEYLNRDL